jgi:hypothetical protein
MFAKDIVKTSVLIVKVKKATVEKKVLNKLSDKLIKADAEYRVV